MKIYFFVLGKDFKMSNEMIPARVIEMTDAYVTRFHYRLIHQDFEMKKNTRWECNVSTLDSSQYQFYAYFNEVDEEDEDWEEGSPNFEVGFALSKMEGWGRVLVRSKFLNIIPTISDVHEFIARVKATQQCIECREGTIGFDLCDNCIGLASTRDDDCAICLCNRKGIWIKTTCHHVFHRSCFQQIQGGMNCKCPLCRKELDRYVESKRIL
jgi:hypothetical protein